LVGPGPRFRAARLIVVAVFAASCGGAGATPASPSQSTPAPTIAAAILPSPTISIPPPNSCTSANGLPDRLCTPGATNPDVTQATITITICVTAYAAQIRPAATYTNSLKIDHMRAYGYAAEAPGDFEEDHLIALELGGDPRDPKNLWPERLTGGSGALQKDRVENWTHDEVCAGRMQLADAQRRMAANWVELYNAMLVTIATPQPTSVPAAEPTIATGASAAIPSPTPAPVLSVSISASRYALVSATTLAGASCNAQAKLPSGSMSSAQGLIPTKIAIGSGSVSWSYTTVSRTTPGTGTHTVTCVLGGVTRNASAPFTVQ